MNGAHARATAMSAMALVCIGCTARQHLGSNPRPTDGGANASPMVEAGASSSMDAGASSDEAAPGDAGHPGKYMFITDGRYTGDLRTEGGAASGALGGDAICAAEAKAAGIGGTFKAWLSTLAEPASRRIAPVGPWSLVEGTVVFPGRAVIGAPLVYPRVTPSGQSIYASDDPLTWTGTDGEGALDESARTCSDWTSRQAADEGSLGNAVGRGGDWTEYRDLMLTSPGGPCSTRARLYCFEQ